MKMPTPPIVGVEQRLSIADCLQATQEANLPRATRRRQAILKKAFPTPSAEGSNDG